MPRRCPAGLTPPTIEPQAGQIAIDAEDNVLYIPVNTEQIRRAPAGNYGAPDPITASSGSKAMALDTAGNLYYTTGANIVQLKAPGHDAASTVVTTPVVGVLAVDGSRNLYWRKTTAPHQVMKAVFNGFTYESPAETGIEAGASELLAVDAFGNLYFVDASTGKQVKRAALSRNRALPAHQVGPARAPVGL